MYRFFLLLFVIGGLFSCNDDKCTLNESMFDGCWVFLDNGSYLEFCKDGKYIDLFSEFSFQTPCNNFVLDSLNCTISIYDDTILWYSFIVLNQEHDSINVLNLRDGHEITLKRMPDISYSVKLLKEDSLFYYKRHEKFLERVFDYLDKNNIVR